MQVRALPLFLALLTPFAAHAASSPLDSVVSIQCRSDDSARTRDLNVILQSSLKREEMNDRRPGEISYSYFNVNDTVYSSGQYGSLKLDSGTDFDRGKVNLIDVATGVQTVTKLELVKSNDFPNVYKGNLSGHVTIHNRWTNITDHQVICVFSMKL